MTRAMGRGPSWAAEEIAVVRDHPEMTAQAIHEACLPNRTPAAIRNMRDQLRQGGAKPAVKEPGDYVEILAALLADDWECMEIWARWNGYSSWRVLSVDTQGWCTLLCTAKGA